METLRNRIDLVNIPFTDRGSRLLLFKETHRLSVRLAERWAKWESVVGHYRKRPPIVTDFIFRDNHDQTITEMELETYPFVVHIRNALGGFDWVFLDPETLLLRMPAGAFGLDFRVNADRGHTDLRGGALHGKRNIAYTTNAQILQNTIEPVTGEEFHVRLQLQSEMGDVLLLNITPRIAFNRSIPDSTTALLHAKVKWQEWFDAIPPVLDEYRPQYEYAWWIMRAGLVNTRYYFTREALLPSKIHYVGVWHWDQVFHALAYRHVDMRLAEDQIRIILDHQREDGMLPDAIHDEGLVNHLSQPVDADVTKPPIMAWGVLKLFETSQHLDFLKEVYEPLARWHQWWINTSSNENGLCEYHHPFSSGLDDCPLWDEGVPVVSPDLNTYLIIQCESLAQIALLIGRSSDAQRFTNMSSNLLNNMIKHLWDEGSGTFRALYKGKSVLPRTLFNLLPLLIGNLPISITERLVDNLMDPTLFWTPYPLATVAITDQTFDPLQMWRGPVWININYLFVEALQRNGRVNEANQLRRKTLNLVMKHDDIYEYYHPMTGERPTKAAPMFGWSAALFIELTLAESHARKI